MIGRRPGSSSPLSRWAQAVSDPGHLSLDAVVAFVDGELGETSAQRATSHVGRCMSCAAEVTAQRQARRRLRGAQMPEAPSTLLSSLRAIPETALPDTPGPDAPGPHTSGPDPAPPPPGPTQGGPLRRRGPHPRRPEH